MILSPRFLKLFVLSARILFLLGALLVVGYFVDPEVSTVLQDYLPQLKSWWIILMMPILMYFIQIPVSVWVYKDARRVFGYTQEEALDAALSILMPPHGQFYQVEYFQTRENFLTNSEFREQFLMDLKERRTPLTAEQHRFVVLLLISVICFIGFGLAMFYFSGEENFIIQLVTLLFAENGN
ncbi:MAG: hypothetical protein A3F26_01910 [Candidatus Ryanbacteria bacterium RIFCSPHIGHO2_12_FULL_47_12b]|uniref:Uncharacterized protein n=1 Tax=Candidatus Ryanbacteria bacterium RIFCSPLOWO2_02_FULL_47_14 TaxID=1802129 RepID=A0A1G2GY54_9BACT|nr:MAG: hypothetical protein UY14_C0011G0015 [Parcubacteria group bacterium GW2011_GWA1_47_9]OGZ46057.1 MAG: hypothetical protein A2844_01795 [Candidatus Ryanbacteria bacterium RIFCSPHIGHO2_01_FULL_48_80]OGZ51160.1 MAG: hypothetical protein A3F26_01910 [Candidatus Ryanbacteria bacterium RIFCSPHIGHO2_12_FULL_47_12b]OGZ52621.1 MAG: hypothetical protein A3A29_01170 [Candidatus Ryanbacteria bacterium RIFCSPLOWO2_01_FULL_47_79]OGZ55144.1 MAG: hypothetical protein A3J04_02760 [Candidatus Ryanbacteria